MKMLKGVHQLPQGEGSSLKQERLLQGLLLEESFQAYLQTRSRLQGQLLLTVHRCQDFPPLLLHKALALLGVRALGPKHWMERHIAWLQHGIFCQSNFCLRMLGLQELAPQVNLSWWRQAGVVPLPTCSRVLRGLGCSTRAWLILQWQAAKMDPWLVWHSKLAGIRARSWNSHRFCGK